MWNYMCIRWLISWSDRSYQAITQLYEVCFALVQQKCKVQRCCGTSELPSGVWWCILQLLTQETLRASYKMLATSHRISTLSRSITTQACLDSTVMLSWCFFGVTEAKHTEPHNSILTKIMSQHKHKVETVLDVPIRWGQQTASMTFIQFITKTNKCTCVIWM